MMACSTGFFVILLSMDKVEIDLFGTTDFTNINRINLKLYIVGRIFFGINVSQF